MIKKTMMLSMLLSTVMFTIGTTDSFADTMGTVTTNLNVRSGPSTKNKVIGTISKNKSVKVLSTSNGWSKVRLSNNKEGYSSSKYIKINQGSTGNNTSNNAQTAVATTSLSVRSGPSAKNKVVGSIDKNKSVKVLSTSNGWSKVRLSNNKEGYASSKYLKMDQSSSGNNSGNSSSKTMKVEATAYTGYSTTSTGQKPVWGTIAVDPKVIPYGTKVYIPYFDKVFVANNCGGAIKGNKIDIFMNTKQECYNWGRKTIEIQILGK